MLLVVGRVGRPHGLRGEVTVEVRTDDPDQRFASGCVLATQPEALGPLTIANARPHAGGLIVSFAGVADRDAAQQLRGAWLVIDSADVPVPDDPDEFHDHQLIGLDVITAAGSHVGTVADVRHHGQDLLVIWPSVGGRKGGAGTAAGSGPTQGVARGSGAGAAVVPGSGVAPGVVPGSGAAPGLARGSGAGAAVVPGPGVAPGVVPGSGPSQDMAPGSGAAPGSGPSQGVAPGSRPAADVAPALTAGAGAAEILVPFVAAIVPEVDLQAGRLIIDPPPGLLDQDTLDQARDQDTLDQDTLDQDTLDQDTLDQDTTA